MSHSQELSETGNSSEQFSIEYLLFCHTFNHTDDSISDEDLKMDLVSFPYPVYITELRIIPLNHRSPEGVGEQVGRTQPSESELTVYVDNVYNLQAAVFETFGILKYDTKNFMLKASTPTAATKVLIHGVYTSITLCLYGSPARPPEQGSDPPPLPILLPPTPQDAQPPLPNNSINSDTQLNEVVNNLSGSGEKRFGTPLLNSNSSDRSSSGSKPKRPKLSEKRTPEDSSNLSGDRINDSQIRSELGEEDSTREELGVSGELQQETSGVSFTTMEETLDDSNDQTEHDLLMEDSWSMSFNPSHCQFSPLKYSRSTYSSQLDNDSLEPTPPRHRTSSHSSSSSSKSKSTNRLRELTRRYRSPPNNEKFALVLEDVVSTVSTLHSLSQSDHGDYVTQVLVTWTQHSLDLNKIKPMPLAANIRFLRAGLKLFSLLVRSGETGVNLMIRHDLLSLLMSIVENDIKSSIKIRSIQCMSEFIEYPQAMDSFIGNKSAEESSRGKTRRSQTYYQRFMKLLLRGAKRSLVHAARDLVAKCHIYELLTSLQRCIDEIISSSNLTQDDSTSGAWLGHASPRSSKENTGVGSQSSPSKGKGKPDVKTEVGDAGAGDEGKDELAEKDDLDDVLWETTCGESKLESDRGVKMELEPIEDSFTRELLDFQLEETETKETNKNVGYIEDGIAEKVINYIRKLCRHITVCCDILETYPPSQQPSLYKESDSRSKLRYRLSNLIKLFRGRSLLQSMLLLLTCQNVQFGHKLFSALRDVFILLIRSQTGMLYMLEESDCTNALIRLLVPAETASHQIYLPVAEYTDEDKKESFSLDNLGYLIFYHLQVLQLVDELRGLSQDLHKESLSENSYLENECFRILHLLYTMTLTPLGKHTVVHVLSLEDNIIPFLKLLEPRKEERNKSYNIQNILSPSAQYVLLLFKVLIHFTPCVDFVFRGMDSVIRLIDSLKDCEFGTLGLLQWLEIFKLFEKKEMPQEDRIRQILKEIELSLDNFNLSNIVEIEPTLLSNLRILSHFLRGISSHDSYVALQVTLNIIYIVGANGILILTQLLCKLADMLLPLWRHGLVLKPSETYTLLSIAGDSVFILKLVLLKLLSVEGMSHNNSMLLRSLFKMYNMFSSLTSFLSESACIRHIAAQVTRDVVEICSAYLKKEVAVSLPPEEESKMEVESSEKETSIAKESKETTSSWTFLLKELFEFTLSAPQFFIGGILLLSELLPIPLPVYTAEEMSSPELVASLRRAREEWSEQLSPFTNECKALIRATAANSSPESHPYLWKCACQIGDLSATLAIAITNQLKELLCSQLEEDSLRKESDKRLSGRSVHLLGTLAVVTQQPSLKSAYLKCLKENPDALKILCDLITREPDICPHPGKLSILMILSSICNPYIGLMVSTNENVPLSEYHVTTGLPGQKELSYIVIALLKHVSMKNQSFSSLLLTLRTLANLSHHDLGMVHFYKYIVEEKSFKFSPVFDNILEGLKALDRSMSSLEDALASISLLIEFIGVLTIPNFFQQEEKQQDSSQSSNTGSGQTLKKIYLPTHFIYSELTQHKDYLQLVLDVLKKTRIEQSGVEEFRNHIIRLKSGLETEDSTVVQNEPLLESTMESLEDQFDKRVVFTVGQQSYYPEYWLPHCPFERTEVKVDPIFLELEKIAFETCPGYNLRDELNKLYHSSPTSVIDPNLARHMRMQSYYRSSAGEAQKALGLLSGSSMISSAMSQVYMRNMHDKFRGRKQNTSRPPSLHVDDFVAREQATYPKQAALIPRSPMTPFLLAPIPGSLLSPHFPSRVAPGIPLSTPVLNPMVRPAWPSHLSPYPPLTSSVRPQSTRIYPHHLDTVHESGPLNRNRFSRGDSMHSRSPSGFSTPRPRQRRDTKSCAKLLT